MDHGKNPSWWYGLPLLHFLTERLKPNEEAKMDMNYTATEPIWWGTESVKEAVNKFKALKTEWQV